MSFFCDILGMVVNRHEDFQEGCEAACNGPYDNRWSKTMIGYGPEGNSFNLEITYNYTHKEKYAKGNDLGFIIVHSTEDVLDKIRKSNLERTEAPDGLIVVDPEGYRFKVSSNGPSGNTSAIAGIRINSHDPAATADFYKTVLGMSDGDPNAGLRTLRYAGSIPFALEIAKSDAVIDFKEAGGRLAVGVPDPAPFEQSLKQFGRGKVHTPYVVLPTPGKVSVAVVILQDPDGTEVCVVNDDGFRQLAQVDPDSQAALEKDMENDRSGSKE